MANIAKYYYMSSERDKTMTNEMNITAATEGINEMNDTETQATTVVETPTSVETSAENVSEETGTQTSQPRAQQERIDARHNSLRGREIGGYFTSNVDVSMPNDEQAREMDQIRAANRNRTVCRACVQAVNPPDEKGIVTIDALYGNSTWIRFIAQDFLADAPRFANIAKDENMETRGKRWFQAARSYMNANINFIVMAIERDEQGQTIVFGSRSLANQAIRNSVFFGKNSNVSVGDYGKAEIVDCRPNRVWVEFCGVEVHMNNAALVAFKYLPDATKDERFSVGKSLYVAVQDISVDKETKTINKLALSHAYIELTSTDIPELTDDLIGQERFGRIIAVRENDYVAIFNNMRCRALIDKKSGNYSYTELKIGDKVLVHINRITSKSGHTVRGRCWKL